MIVVLQKTSWNPGVAVYIYIYLYKQMIIIFKKMRLVNVEIIVMIVIKYLKTIKIFFGFLGLMAYQHS